MTVYRFYPPVLSPPRRQHLHPARYPALIRPTLILLLICCFFFEPTCPVFAGNEHRQLTDASGREVTVPRNIRHIICSGAGCLRLITYLQCQDRVVGVDDMEKKRQQFDARPYALAHPEFKSLPIFGEFRGRDHLERIMSLSPLPQVIFKTFATSGTDPDELQQKTGIPVVTLSFGSLTRGRDAFYRSLKLAGAVLECPERAQAVIDFFEGEIRQLAARTEAITDLEQKRCYVGGIAFKGPHGFQSTEPGYPPFQLVKAHNVAAVTTAGRLPRQSNVAKEMLLQWDPDILFLDLSTLQVGDGSGGLHELRTDPVYQALSAVVNGKVYGLLPYNWYSMNQGSILANAWFIGKTLYPGHFSDIDPRAKADEIYTFLVGKSVFDDMNQRFQSLVFKEPLDAL